MDRYTALQNAYEMEPLEGNPEGIRQHAHRYSQVAEAVGAAVADLRTAVADAQAHESEAMTELSVQAEDVVPRLAQIRDRYETAGTLLGTYAGVLAEAQGEVDRALRTRESLADDIERYDARIREAEGDLQLAAPEDLEPRRDDVTRLENAVAPLTHELVVARTRYDAAVSTADEAASLAESRLEEAVDADGLTDSVWENVTQWVMEHADVLSTIKNWLGGLAAVLGILSLFFPVLAPFALVAAGATWLLGGAMASTGNGSWLDFGLDTVGVLTLGLGSAAGGLVRGAQGAIRMHRTSRVAWAAAKRPGIFGTLLRPARALFSRGAARRQVLDDFARALPDGMPLTGRPAYVGSMRNAWYVLRDGGIDGAKFTHIANNSHVGAGGMVDDALLRVGRGSLGAAQSATWIGMGGTFVSYHDDGAKAFGQALGSYGTPLINYSDWWREVDASTYSAIGTRP